MQAALAEAPCLAAQVHVTYVLQCTLLIIKADEQLEEPLLTDLDRLALLIAAYCHDVDHDGAPDCPSKGC